MKLKFFSFSLVILSIFGCGKDDKKDTSALIEGSFAGSSYFVIDAGDLVRSESQIKGSGSIVFKSPLASTDAKTNYNLTFSLEDGGSVELVAQSDGSLNKGVSVILTRAGTALNASLKADDVTTEVKVLSGISAAGVVTISIDVHNDESPTHILLWNGTADDFAEDAALLNSEADAETPGQGKSTAWGLVLAKATLTSATLSDPKFVE